MKRTWLNGFVLLFVLVFVLTACSSGSTSAGNESANGTAGSDATNTADASASLPNASSTAANSTATSSNAGSDAVNDEIALNKFTDTDMAGNVTFWTWTPDVYKDVVKEFNKVYPKINVKVVSVDVHAKLPTTLAAGKGAPDVAQVGQDMLYRFMKGGVLEDLLQEPFNAGKYRSDTTEYNWERYMSQDNTKLLGMPWDVTPGVLYYRADIFDELGIESDPAALGEYIADPDNWLTICQTLSANKKYGMEWRDGPVNWAGDAVGYFDSDFNWLRNTDEIVKVLDITKKQNQLNIAPHVSALWDDKGKAMTKSGQLTAFAIGSWGARELANIMPDQKGKWRATSLPLGINIGMGGSAFVLPKQGQNKLQAWKFVEFMQRSEAAWKIFVKQSVQPGWISVTQTDWYKNLTNDYLGGQNDFALYSALAEKIQPRKNTELDSKGWDIWWAGITKALEKNIDSKTALNQIQDEVKRKLQPDIDKLKQELAANP